MKLRLVLMMSLLVVSTAVRAQELTPTTEPSAEKTGDSKKPSPIPDGSASNLAPNMATRGQDTKPPGAPESTSDAGANGNGSSAQPGAHH
jgi:hypothetical protein